MIAVLPFFRNVLEPCKDSRVFRPPNPWLMAILSLISEIYALPKLKLNLKFEIETVFRTMNLQISDVKASDTLRCVLPMYLTIASCGAMSMPRKF